VGLPNEVPPRIVIVALGAVLPKNSVRPTFMVANRPEMKGCAYEPARGMLPHPESR
jgi:hypothetical protein